MEVTEIMTITAIELGVIIAMVANTVYNIFTVLDATLLLPNVSILDIFIAIMLMEIIFDYINSLLHTHKGDEDMETSGMSDTEVGINADADEIDFSDEIVRE